MRDLDVLLTFLDAMDLRRLRDTWRKQLRTSPPKVSAGLLRLALAHALQEKALGGLSKAAERQLRRMEKTFARAPAAIAATEVSTASSPYVAASTRTPAPTAPASPSAASPASAAGSPPASDADSSRSTASRRRTASRMKLPLAPRPGMRLVREWQGVAHIVTVGEDGVLRWNDREWRSLSQIARTITGTQWSGPAFFGLR